MGSNGVCIYLDRQTDGQNYDSQDSASIAASSGKNPAIATNRRFFAINEQYMTS